MHGVVFFVEIHDNSVGLNTDFHMNNYHRRVAVDNFQYRQTVNFWH